MFTVVNYSFVRVLYVLSFSVQCQAQALRGAHSSFGSTSLSHHGLDPKVRGT